MHGPACIFWANLTPSRFRLVWNKVDREEDGHLSTAKVGVGFGRIVVSDIDAPILLAILA
jgi:hypothetical protein